MIKIKEAINEITAVGEGFALTVLKDGPARVFKRVAVKQDNPKTKCPECATTLERVQARTSTGHLAGEFLYCNHCSGPVGPGRRTETWVVAELDGVRLYAMGTQFILTKQDFHP